MEVNCKQEEQLWDVMFMSLCSCVATQHILSALQAPSCSPSGVHVALSASVSVIYESWTLMLNFKLPPLLYNWKTLLDLHGRMTDKQNKKSKKIVVSFIYMVPLILSWPTLRRGTSVEASPWLGCWLHRDDFLCQGGNITDKSECVPRTSSCLL